jgi:murein tripeptide amidase MpaA
MINKILTVFVAVLLTVISSVSVSAGNVKLTWDHYYDGPAVLEAMRSLNSEYPGLTELRSIGLSEEGRDIWLLTINNSKTGKDTEKPGVYLDGAIHGNEIQATEVCLYVAWYLLDSYGSVPMVKELVDSRVFYIVPIVNVDNRARFLDSSDENQRSVRRMEDASRRSARDDQDEALGER